MSVEVRSGPAFQASRPRVLFQTQAARAFPRWATDRNAYVATPDGQRFLINVPVEDTSSPITVVVNWMAPLPR